MFYWMNVLSIWKKIYETTAYGINLRRWDLNCFDFLYFSTGLHMSTLIYPKYRVYQKMCTHFKNWKIFIDILIQLYSILELNSCHILLMIKGLDRYIHIYYYYHHHHHILGCIYYVFMFTRIYSKIYFIYTTKDYLWLHRLWLSIDSSKEYV